MFEQRNHRLLFRSYLWLVGGLLLVAVVLDFGFGHLQSRGQQEVDRWLLSSLELISARLEAVPANEREQVAADIAGELGVGVHLLSRDEVQMSVDASEGLISLVDAEGHVSYLFAAASLNAIIRLGPIPQPEESLLLDLLPPVFYLSIFVVVGMWLRPLLRDIKVLSSGTERFAADYRSPTTTVAETTELTTLARSIDDMAARLSGVLRSQKELIAALSHEMRTPLARIRFALAVIDDKVDDELRQKLLAMNDDVEEIDELVSAMLDYARLDHPDIEMQQQAVPVRNWLDKIVGKGSGDAVEVVVGSTVDTFRMDPRLMELALSNLVVNATKYGERKVRLVASQEGGSYVLSVEDDGPGVPPGERDNVFKAFTRLDDSRNRETGGYGLGLAVVARVAELHGGAASVDDSPALGGGRFVLRWPVGDVTVSTTAG